VSKDPEIVEEQQMVKSDCAARAGKGLHRRQVLKAMVGAAAVGGVGSAMAAVPSDKKTKWADEADVVIVGSGIAATAAAIAITRKGGSVIMLEKMPFKGGTTIKSAGVFWIPNNRYLKSQAVVDDRLDALRYMARLGYPHIYRGDAPQLGLPAETFALLETFVDNASQVLETLISETGLKVIPWQYAPDAIWPDYYGHIPENKVHKGRSLVTDVRDIPERHFWAGGGGNGESLLWMLQQGFEKRPIKLLLDHKVLAVTQNAKRQVTGVVADGEDGSLSFRARRAVFFATGGFTHNPAMADSFLRGKIWGGCASPGSTGDFVGIAAGVGAPLGNMNNAWWAQIPVEVAVKTRSVPSNVWSCPGDSMIEVNRYGRRFGNEKAAYNERAQLHFTWDPVKLEFPNELGFMIWDERTAKGYAGYDPLPAPGATSAHIISAPTLAELEKQISTRLEALAPHTGGLKLDTDFGKNLKLAIERFNGFAKKGKDEDFQRGESPNEAAWQFAVVKPLDNPNANKTLFPIAARGPYYAVILGAGTLDTKGGPSVNTSGQVLDGDRKPIAGLYAGGNCVASAAGQAYWGGGGTIGPAMTFSFLAGEAAMAEVVKEA
jgi:3-oxosteroid 1-dehydrogenase